MTRPRAPIGAGVVALVLAASIIAGCGDDDDPATSTVRESSTTTTETTSTTETTTTPGDIDPSEDVVVPDEGHEGGGPDPGSQEATGGVGADDNPSADDTAQNSGGVKEDSGSDSGGVSPTDQFEQFCEDHPEACE